MEPAVQADSVPSLSGKAEAKKRNSFLLLFFKKEGLPGADHFG
jgi:hypothetical protein